MLRLPQNCLQPALHMLPGAAVPRLFLAPYDLLGIRVHIQVLLDLLPRKRVKLLDSRNSDISDIVLVAVFEQRSIYLARAHDDSSDAVRFIDSLSVFGVGNDVLKARVT